MRRTVQARMVVNCMIVWLREMKRRMMAVVCIFATRLIAELSIIVLKEARVCIKEMQ
jgi:hypothetical protein